MPTTLPLIDLIFVLGLLFAAAVLFGGVAQALHLPRVVGYLLGGLALMVVTKYLWPVLTGDLGQPALQLGRLVVSLDPVKEIALGFIMFDIGARFELATLRRTLRSMAPVAFAEMGATALLVTSGLLLVGASWQVALLLGVMAMATAPVTTLLVLRQYDSEGPLTEHLYTLLAFNNAFSILAFGLAFTIVELVAGRAAAHRVATDVPWDLAGSVILGLLSGLLVSYFYERVSPRVRSSLLIALLVCTIGISRTLGVPYMLALLVTGMLMANTTEFHREIAAILDGVAAPLYVLFFVAAGAGLHLEALGAIGVVGVTYVALRTAGKLGGAWLGARLAGSPAVVRRYTGLGLLSQAGAAIGLAILAGARDPALGESLLTVVLAAVVIFEIAGPILLKTVLVSAGEVRVVHFLDHSPRPGYLTSFRTMFARLGESLGLHGRARPTLAALRVRDVMAANVKSIPQSAPYAAIIDFVEHSRHNLFPVVDQTGRYLGYIPYQVLQDLMVDPSLGRLLIARDFVQTEPIHLAPTDDLDAALDRFEALGLDALPVVDPEGDRLLVGLLERREVLRLLRRRIQHDDKKTEARKDKPPRS